MWKIPTNLMCRKHLLGEHVEMHMLVGSHQKNISLHGYINNGLLDTNYIFQRHEELVEEMCKRGYNHQSPVDKDTCTSIKETYKECAPLINTDVNEKELYRRCADCRERIDNESK